MEPKTPVTVPVDPRLAKQAGDLKVGLSKVAEDGLSRAVQAERKRLWRLENAAAIEAANTLSMKTACLSSATGSLDDRRDGRRLEQSDYLAQELPADLLDGFNTRVVALLVPQP